MVPTTTKAMQRRSAALVCPQTHGMLRSHLRLLQMLGGRWQLLMPVGDRRCRLDALVLRWHHLRALILRLHSLRALVLVLLHKQHLMDWKIRSTPTCVTHTQ